MQSQKVVAAIHDISGVGRCSLSVIMPIISAFSHQCCPVPTAVLSSHTGGLGDPVSEDLTEFVAGSLRHYKRLDIAFDSIYTGYLASVAQIDHCLEYFAAYPSSLKVVDPVMGDHGKPYRGFGPQLTACMKELVKAADVTTPNLTEACILLGEDYTDAPMSIQGARSMLLRLSQLGPKQVVLTGVRLSDHDMVNVGYDREQGAFWRVDCDYVPEKYPGTGDMFAAVLVASLLSGDSLPMGIERGTRFLELAIKTTYSFKTDTRYGVMFEKALPYLIQAQVLKDYKVL